MSSQEWWKPQVSEVLDQGDIFADIPLVLPVEPLLYLHKQQLKGGSPGYFASEEPKILKGGAPQFLATGRVATAMLLSHGCDIDKQNNKRLTFVSVSPLSDLPPVDQERVAARTVVAMLYLPGVPLLGDAYADFRLIGTAPREMVDKKTRIASMQSAAQEWIHAHLFEFFVRKKLKD
jgi:hypothetical protein